MKRCVNIDWLEVYALEPATERRDADYYEVHDYAVLRREYGTPMYHEMFTLCDTLGYPLLEIRRAPKSTKDNLGLFDPNGCHIRLSNRTCYFDSCAQFLADFLLQHNYVFSRISRLDVCLDFKRFDSHDYPKQFVKRYMEGKYSKMNQTRFSAHGEDLWSERDCNSISWGSPKSMIRTRLYNKTLELKQVKDKPYIRQAWFFAGLVDNPTTCTQLNPDGSLYKPDIWRLEFQISSSVKRWYVIHPDGNDHKYLSIRHTLEQYFTREQIQACVEGLIRHYFHFKYYDSNVRKDRCRDKQLFYFSPRDTFYKIARDDVASPVTVQNADRILLNRLIRYQREHQFNEDLCHASQVIIDALEEQSLRFTTSTPYSREKLTALRLIMSERFKSIVGCPVAVERQIREVVETTLDEIWLEK